MSIVARRRTARLHMTLLDPDKQTAEDAASLAGEAGDAGTDAIMVGGSTGVTQGKVDDTVLAIKGAAKVPVILFPASAGSLSPHADALFFMSLLNSKDPRLVVGGGIRTEKAAGAAAAAGADIVVTGTIVEVAREGDALRRIVEAVKAV